MQNQWQQNFFDVWRWVLFNMLWLLWQEFHNLHNRAQSEKTEEPREPTDVGCGPYPNQA